MTLMDERETRIAVRSSAADGPESMNPAMTRGGAYTADVLRVVRGTPNPEELAALVAALLITRRAREQAEPADQAGPGEQSDRNAAHEQTRRPERARLRYTAPGSWAAGQ